MKARAAILSGTCLLLAACGGAAQPQQSVLQQEEARARELAELKGWDRAFAGPAETIAAANQFGFYNGAYKATGAWPAFRSTGREATISNSFAPKPNTASFAASGAAADKLDALTFSLTITDPDKAAMAKSRFRKILDGFLFHYGIAAKDLVQNFVTQEVPASETLPGATVTAEKLPVEGGGPASRRLIVTFTRSGATAPANPEPEAQGTEDGNRR